MYENVIEYFNASLAESREKCFNNRLSSLKKNIGECSLTDMPDAMTVVAVSISGKLLAFKM